MKRLIVILIPLLFVISQGVAQDGHLSLKHFSVPIPKQDYVFNDLTIDGRGRLLLAHRRELLQFDGRNWEKLSVNSSPLRFIKLDSTLFLLTREGISKIEENKYYQNNVRPVFRNPEFLIGADLIKHKSTYYYLAGSRILALFPPNFKVDTVFNSELGYNDIFTYQDKLYAFNGNFLLEYYEGAWLDLNLYAPDDTDFIFSCQTDSLVFFAYDNGDFFAFDGKNFNVFSEELNEYLRDNYPVSGKILGDKIVIATLNGGAVLVDIASKKILNTIQYYNGLPSDEVTAVTSDDQQGIWLAHGAGISRASLEIPIKEFHHYPGLRGIPEAVLMHNDTLYVGTNEGLYFLTQVKDYETLKKVMKEKVRVELEPERKPEDENESKFLDNIFNLSKEQDGQDQEQFIEETLDKYKKIYRKQGFHFGKLKDKLAEKESALRDSIANIKAMDEMMKSEKPAAPDKKQVRFKTINKVVNVSKLKSIKYQFLPVENIERKVTELIETPKGVIAVTTVGVFLINGTIITKLSDRRFIERAFYQKNEKTLWLAGEFGLFSVDMSTSNFTTQNHFSNAVYDIAIHDQQMALVGDNEVFVFKLLNKQLKSLQSFYIENDFSDKMMIFYEKGFFKVLKLDGVYIVDQDKDEVILEDKFTESLRYFVKDTRQTLWLDTPQDEWKIKNSQSPFLNLQWLKVLPYIKYIHAPSDSIIYLVAENRVIALQANTKKWQTLPESFINSVYKQNEELSEYQELKLEYSNNSLKINLSTIDYLFPEGVSYQYFVKGLTEEWSDWSKAGEIDFPYLPVGEYVLQIKARSGFSGEITDFDLSFEVLPPYWKTWWFYVLEIAFFSTIILISLKLNRTSRNSYLTNTVTFLTLILILEFIATILENNLQGYVEDSPVYAFIINVILALTISPLGKLMNKLLLIINTRHIKRVTHKMRAEQLQNQNNEQN
ncbi:hypothetical protein GCM10011506_04060 [Marivirga lumbricoides]|uniref:Two component regulator three Y domain-containing protein n=1 Tax=Marivirga lumbricoides TaxID=1046115 RepID=A0ABQ1LAH5_9BACT|nr:hypothetical protein GCM10011506_04060 [Marivirga lumbricoides]